MFDTNTAFKSLKRSYLKNIPEYLALWNKQYPGFVYEKRPKTLKNEIPVFTLHAAEPHIFEEQMSFLSRNNYETLTADRFYESITGNKPIPERAIVLTFDDGLEGVWTVAYPILKKYGFSAVCFIIPGLIKETDTFYPNLEDYWNGKSTLLETAIRKKALEFLCTWQEIRRMHDSGTIDFQSHTMFHSLIFTSPEIEDFIHPRYDFNICNINVPMFKNNGTENISRGTDLGMPIYANAPRFSGKKRFFDDVELRRICIEHVKDHGGGNFYKNRGWRKTLLRVVSNYRKKYGEKGQFESTEDQREALYNDLLESKLAIEKRLAGKTVNHLCYPWWVGSDLSIELSKKAGYLMNFWGIVEERRTSNKVGDNPYRIGRFLGDEWIFRLPGEGRKPLSKIFREKFMRNYMGLVKKTNYASPANDRS